MYGKPMRVQGGQQGFTPSRFHPMGAIVMPAPAIVAPAPVSPVVVRRDPAFILPPAAPVYVTESVPAVGMSDDTKMVIGVGAAIALLFIGAAIS